jgi:hypothetical protein
MDTHSVGECTLLAVLAVGHVGPEEATVVPRRSRQHRKLPVPVSFRPERREHWLDRHEREVDEHEELLRKITGARDAATSREDRGEVQSEKHSVIASHPVSNSATSRSIRWRR